MVDRVSSYFPKGGHSATETKLKHNMNTHMVKRHREPGTKPGNREPQQSLYLKRNPQYPIAILVLNKLLHIQSEAKTRCKKKV